MQGACKKTAKNTRPAYTLVELLTSLTVMTVLAGGIASAIFIASRAVDDPNKAASRVLEQSTALNRMAADLSCATSFSTLSKTGLKIVVADRDGDAQPEQIKYSWSGNPGDPLIRSYNQGANVPIVNDVQALELTYSYRLVEADEQDGPGDQGKPGGSDENSESDEKVLIGYDYSGGSSMESQITRDFWSAQFFLPEFTDEVVAWSITGVSFMARSEGQPTGGIRVQIRNSNGGVPGSDVLKQVVVNERDLPQTRDWHEVSFSALKDLDPDTGVCLVLAPRDAAGGTHCVNVFEQSGAVPANTYYLRTNSAGGSWFALNGMSMLFQVRGTITTSGTQPPSDPPQTEPSTRLASINIGMISGDNRQARAETAVRILNEPEVDVATD